MAQCLSLSNLQKNKLTYFTVLETATMSVDLGRSPIVYRIYVRKTCLQASTCRETRKNTSHQSALEVTNPVPCEKTLFSHKNEPSPGSKILTSVTCSHLKDSKIVQYLYVGNWISAWVSEWEIDNTRHNLFLRFRNKFPLLMGETDQYYDIYVCLPVHSGFNYVCFFWSKMCWPPMAASRLSIGWRRAQQWLYCSFL